MSFWGATVITSLFAKIPVVGQPIVTLLWGGFSVDNPTLNRFFALHYLLPFIIVGLIVVHLWALHIPGSNNPLGIEATPADKIPFHPYYTAKDAFGTAVFLVIYLGLVFYAPEALGNSDNNIPADPLQTPASIVPEWYLLPFYAILRSVPNILFIEAKLAGVITMVSAILILLFLPWLDRSPVRSATFRPIYKVLFWLFLICCVVLGWVGSQHPEGAPLIIGRIATVYYFLHFLVLLPLISRIEKPRPLPDSISQPVLKA
jgi:quinol-cytochrome oxidoreductase complex cytochrome b subunit